MGSIIVALLQMAGCGADQAQNLQRGEAFCRQAKELGADIALFPELWNIGGTGCPSDATAQEARRAAAIGDDDDFVAHFRNFAKELEMAIALTYLERWKPGPRNSVSLFDRQGRIAKTYSQVHTCDFGFDAACTPGDHFYVCSLKTDRGTVKVGAMICYDREFPESARTLMLKGAELILTPNACMPDDTRVAQFRARAFENMVGVAMTNYAAPKSNGRSIAFDAVCFDERGESVDNLIVEAREAEGIYLAEFDVQKIRAYRQRETWGNAYRKPQA